MTYATPLADEPELRPLLRIESLNMDIGDSVTVFACGQEYTLSLRDDGGSIALSLSQMTPTYGYARTYASVKATRTEHHGFIVTDKELEEEDQPKAEA